MAATGTPTPNIGLRIPVGTDPASVDDINYNSNLIDTKLGAVGSDSVQDQIDALNSKINQRNSLTVSVATSAPVTIEKNNCYRVLNIVIINLRIRVSGSYGGNQVLLQGLPQMYGQTQASGSTAGAITSNKKRFGLDEHGQIIAVESLESSDGVIGLSGVYVAV